jgi:hypothetical protein
LALSLVNDQLNNITNIALPQISRHRHLKHLKKLELRPTLTVRLICSEVSFAELQTLILLLSEMALKSNARHIYTMDRYN